MAPPASLEPEEEEGHAGALGCQADLCHSTSHRTANFKGALAGTYYEQLQRTIDLAIYLNAFCTTQFETLGQAKCYAFKRAQWIALLGAQPYEVQRAFNLEAS